MAATPAMLPLTPAAPLKAGEVVAAPEPPDPPLVLVPVARGVEVPAGVEPAAPEPEGVAAGVVAPPVAELEPEAELEALEESELVAVVSEPELVSVAELLEVVELSEVAVSMGGTEMGWPAEEHWATTALETASDS